MSQFIVIEHVSHIKYNSSSVLLNDITAYINPIHRTGTGLIHVRHQIHKQYDERSNHSLVVAFADEEQHPPGLYGGQDERRDADSGDEAAGGLWSPFLNDKALLRHRDVLVLPHPPRKKQTFPAKILRVLRQRYYSYKAKYER